MNVESCHVLGMVANRKMFKEKEGMLDPIIRFTLEIWFTVVRKYRLENEIEILNWMAYDTNFKPGNLNLKFKQWATKGLTILDTVMEKGEIKSFLKLRREYELEQQDFYMYLQIRDYFNKEIKPDLPGELNKVVVTLCNAYKNKYGRVISELYQGMVANRNTSTLYIKDKWGKELNEVITEDMWHDIIETQQTTSNSRMSREFCWKSIVRFFITPKMKKGRTAVGQPCWRLCGEQNVTHIFFGIVTKLRDFGKMCAGG